MTNKAVLLSGIQPTNKLTIGNYLGAIKQMVKHQHSYKTILFVADLHARTLPLTYYKYTFKDLKQYSFDVVKMYVALGVDIEKTSVFFQSSVPQHLELFYFLLAHSYLGELKRMTQYKFLLTKLKEPNQTEACLIGILIYPVLMAADILLYQSNYISVGKDQEQHLELCSDIALRINEKYKKTIFKIPEKLSNVKNEYETKIMDLQDPSKKMSKTCDDPNGVIFLTDTPEEATTKIMKSKTDSFNSIELNREKQPEIFNLLVIYSSLSDVSLTEAHQKFKDHSYFEFKKNVAETVSSFLKQIQERYQSINEEKLREKITQHAAEAELLAKETLNQIYNSI